MRDKVCDFVPHNYQKQTTTDHNVWRERTAEADSNRGPSAYQPNALPLGQTDSLRQSPSNTYFKLRHCNLGQSMVITLNYSYLVVYTRPAFRFVSGWNIIESSVLPITDRFSQSKRHNQYSARKTPRELSMFSSQARARLLRERLVHFGQNLRTRYWCTSVDG